MLKSSCSVAVNAPVLSLRLFRYFTALILVVMQFMAAPARANTHESSALNVKGSAHPGFVSLPPVATGITFTNYVSSKSRSLYTLIPSGLAAGDVDGDGLCDLYFCSTDGLNVLYRNLGDWKFEDITAKAGVACPGQHSIAATFADFNGDGALDLIVTARGGPNRLFFNDGKGHFTEDLGFPGRESKLASTSIAVADVDGDGALDIYICNYRSRSYLDDHIEVGAELSKEWQRVRDGKELSPQFKDQFYAQGPGLYEKGEPDVLLINDGKGHFKTADESYFKMPVGSLPPGPLDGSGLAVQFRDFNGDGSPDIYVCNDFHTPDRFWLNDGRGHFTLASPTMMRHMSFGSMAVDGADLNLDGRLGFFVGDMLSRDYSRRQRQRGIASPGTPQTDNFGLIPQYTQNTFFLNRGDNTYAEIASFAGLTASEWTWGAIFLDGDLDGYPDLLISCGNLQDYMDADAMTTRSKTMSRIEEMENFRRNLPVNNARCQFFRNGGDLRFEEVGEQYGFRAERAHGGMVTCDLDNDGDLDVVLNDADGAPEIYRNDNSAPRIAVKLHGRGGNVSGVGAKVKLIGKKTQEQELISGGRYSSGCDYTLSFAARADWAPYRLQVTWRDGRMTEVPEVLANRVYVISETNTAPSIVPEIPKIEPLFEDASSSLNHTNYENPFDDFASQPLLPNRMSRLGPGVSWFDLDGDGADDLIIGASRGSTAGIYKNLGNGRFGLFNDADKQMGVRLDLTSVLGYRTSQGPSLVMGVSSLEDQTLKDAAQFVNLSRTNTWVSGPHVTRPKNITGPLALADLDGDGNLDVFIGGRMKSGRYPEAADSMLLLQDGHGQLKEVGGPAAAALKNLGLVSGAVSADLNGDGAPDLIVATEWGAIQILLDTPKGFVNATAAWGMDKLTGWWNGVAVGDFDGDGRIDIVASNWGENSKYEENHDAERPLRIYYGDFNEMNRVEIVETHQDKFTRRWLPDRDLKDSAAAVPYIRGNTPTFKAFGEADLVEAYGERITNAPYVEARELRSMVFLNRGSKFESHPLPMEAQWSPAFGVNVADFNGDGNDDIFLAQNFFSSQPETMRNDAGRGLLLFGDGKGGFRPASAAESGIAIYGEQRGSAVSDYDGDGRADLVVTQSDERTVLLHNRAAKPGLRVRLEGGPGNPQCVGAVIRAVSASGLGRAQVVTAGSGYWSQDSSTLIVTSAKPITGLNIRWPDGSVEDQPISSSDRSVTVKQKTK